ncbi:MAG: hypothetical protein MPEBLZ_01641 [Candidatus Methanoperedens nitroreducens]|uniref:Uncharacterized protein n=1 Tax=Candidatus Methanoperedens nitratireducens TaxID=1392998 RepID=A0A0P8CKW2_9EURY|nr:MAG: hypothetical protein MPEBLZ_01641 [Candidatus Methanoperedens sp. BLZ1]
MFQTLLLEYNGLKLSSMKPIEDGEDDIVILQIPPLAGETGMLRSMYSADARIENDYISIPLRDATSNYAAAEVFIKSKRVYIPARIFGHRFGVYSKQVFSALVKIAEQTIQYNTKTKFMEATAGFSNIIDSIANTHGPWILRNKHEKAIPLVEFIMKAMESAGNLNRPMTIMALVGNVKQYKTQAKWEVVEREKILNNTLEELLNTLIKLKKDSIYIQEFIKSELGPQGCLIKIGAPRRIILTGIDDFSKLMEFPCFSRAIKEKSVSHHVRAAMFSTLLWFYDVEQCTEIIEKKIGVPNFDRERTVYQLNSLLETDPSGKTEPKYCYGVNGFAHYCVGYENCKRCWLKVLKLPDRYFEKKRKIMDGTDQMEHKVPT